MHLLRYHAEHECPKGHRFMAEANPFVEGHVSKALCPTCYDAWIAANVPLGTQIGKAIETSSVSVVHL